MVDERLIPSMFNHPVDVVVRSIQRYLDAVTLLGRTGKGECWLDFGCGDGYGTGVLSNFCSLVEGYDPNVYCHKFLPKRGHDAVFLIEVFEHVPRNEVFDLLSEVKSVANRDIIVSTPIVPKSNPNPVNPHHCYEYSIGEFVSVIQHANMQVVGSSIKPCTFTDGETKMQGLFKVEP